ncbi:MAG TPA: sigma 54-interacting transcriptional regulator [Dissulfurispiraceae bacterium]|nr:sigma 54-interacting transcriptional regulator [Dissulfurispiraceae bacterium]
MNPLLSNPEFLKSVIETMSDGLMVIDKDSTILFFNRAAEEITGYKREDIIGKQCSMIDNNICSYNKQVGDRKKCTLFESGTMQGARCHLRGRDGREIHLLKNAVLLKDSKGEVVGAVEVMTNVTSLDMKDLEIERLKSELMHGCGFMGLLGMSQPMRLLQEQIENAASCDAHVLISGESGTGKELVAEAIHKLSRRDEGPFVKVNCAALNEFLLESELFGHVRGAFTGAVKDRQGRFEAAHKGSIFLDEIGDMSASMQVKLLRVIQEKQLERVGDHKPINVDVRLITATNKDLARLMEAGSFREDLFYRINVIPIQTPPLRDRPDDLPLLVSHLLERISLVNRKRIQSVSPSAMEAFEAYNWPGNVRQLINALEYAAITCKGDTIDIADLPEYLFNKDRTKLARKIPKRPHKDKDYILAALGKFNGNRTLAARHLGVSRVTLWKILKELNVR